MSTHLMLATLTKTEELALDAKEAQALAVAIADVQKFYPMSRVSAKTLAWYNLAQTAGLVYGTRVAVLRMKMAKPKPPRNPPASPFTQSAAPGPAAPSNTNGASPRVMPFDPAFGIQPIGGNTL